mmetsp:Transcript_63656/g.138649  ORF Transcript_63656/g.138649 Transcript_63656/m.138649 type:complete len:216 (+) Transcript_63656:3977-4624(+)
MCPLFVWKAADCWECDVRRRCFCYDIERPAAQVYLQFWLHARWHPDWRDGVHHRVHERRYLFRECTVVPGMDAHDFGLRARCNDERRHQGRYTYPGPRVSSNVTFDSTRIGRCVGRGLPEGSRGSALHRHRPLWLVRAEDQPEDLQRRRYRGGEARRLHHRERKYVGLLYPEQALRPGAGDVRRWMAHGAQLGARATNRPRRPHILGTCCGDHAL